MYKGHRICAVLPARNEAEGIDRVVGDLVALEVIDRIIVCDNGSTDDTARCAESAGAEVVHHETPGYGGACLRALGEIESTDIVLFVDADNSVCIDEARVLLEAIHCGADLVIGTRIRPWREPGSMTTPQVFGNWLAGKLIGLIWRYRITDLGPFRAIRHGALNRLDMRDERFGWTVEMQVKAILQGMIMVEVPVHYYRRVGRSKISGTIKGVLAAGHGIIGTILKLAWHRSSRESIATADIHHANIRLTRRNALTRDGTPDVQPRR